MFITPAFAQAAAPGGGGGLIVQLLPFILIFAIIYFLILRPQQKRAKAHREMVSALRRGDFVVTSGGLIGKVIKVLDDNEISVEVAEGVKVRLLRSSVSEVRSKGEPASSE
ncbi:Protein translocase subunit YajC [hydrothermal vent metagenome]|uniref:Protein translocase subunit YajC n=1 Tax=hydrothermal vent metagenome TaxID=652676 RepID=A0A3B0SXY5_9ZZZZ